MHHTPRRSLLIAVAGLPLCTTSALAQTERRVRRIGYFSLGNARSTAGFLAAFHAGMLELRWLEGRDYVIDARYANGLPEASAALATALVATQPDLLLVPAEEYALLLARGTKTIPIVFAIAQDPVGNGLAASLRQPGGNLTGLTSLATELSAKRLQLLKEAFPRVGHVALLFEPNSVGSVSQAKEIEGAAPKLGMRVTQIEVRQPADIEPGIKRAAALGSQAYVATASGITNSERQAIADRIAVLKVPAMFPISQYVEAGGLMSYGPSFADNYRRAAAYVDKIFKGAKPGDPPIQQPTRFELVVNMKTAKAMGFKFSEAFMIRVDRVIE